MTRKRIDARIKIGGSVWYLHRVYTSLEVAKSAAKRRRELLYFARVVPVGNQYAVYERITSPTTGRPKKAGR